MAEIGLRFRSVPIHFDLFHLNLLRFLENLVKLHQLIDCSMEFALIWLSISVISSVLLRFFADQMHWSNIRLNCFSFLIFSFIDSWFISWQFHRISIKTTFNVDFCPESHWNQLVTSKRRTHQLLFGSVYEWNWINSDGVTLPFLC